MNASLKAQEKSACGIIWDCRQNEGNVFVRNNKIMWTEVNAQFIRVFHVIWAPYSTVLRRPLRYHPAEADISGLLPTCHLIAFLSGVQKREHCFTSLASGICPSGDRTRFVSTQQGYFVGW